VKALEPEALIIIIFLLTAKLVVDFFEAILDLIIIFALLLMA